MMEETKDLREKFMTAMQEKLDELSGEEYEIRSYASDKNKDVASVQFVIMTEEVPLPRNNMPNNLLKQHQYLNGAYRGRYAPFYDVWMMVCVLSVFFIRIGIRFC